MVEFLASSVCAGCSLAALIFIIDVLLVALILLARLEVRLVLSFLIGACQVILMSKSEFIVREDHSVTAFFA